MRMLLVGLIAWLSIASDAHALEYVTFRRDGKESQVTGRLIVKAKDGGVMLMSADGQLWTVEAQELVSQRTDENPFVPYTAAQAGDAMLAELPAGFEVYTTAHYVICHNTSRAYAQWCGALFERLYGGFINFWARKGFELREPTLPLVCVVFADEASYTSFSKQELGDGSKNIVAYYSLRTNRVTMFDLTGVESLRRPNDRRGLSAQINQMLARPEAERMVATTIHEATHQIAFNCGLQTRFADIPLWVSEGVAMYFEAPDLSNAQGWKTIGEINRPRLRGLRDYAARRPTSSMHSLIVDDKRLRDPRQAVDAYAEAWALNYFLIRQKPKQYVGYLKGLAAKGPLVWDEPEERLQEFKAAFGDLEKLDAEFVRHMQRVR